MKKIILLLAICSLFYGIEAAKAAGCEGKQISCPDASGTPILYQRCDSCMLYNDTQGRDAYIGVCSEQSAKCTAGGVSCTDINGLWIYYPNANRCAQYSDARGRIGWYGICQ